MHARAAAATTTALLGSVALLLPASGSGAADGDRPPVVLAHRGASAYAPENTLAAVGKAAELGIQWVENGYVSAVHGVSGAHGRPLEVFTGPSTTPRPPARSPATASTA
ncbi:hypothetical protein GCM10010254_36320 [Streptomyces chromofuscus]|nr:hypothetical protein GCM10010254_36320 [Streptomyces chromofuscus]